MAIRHAEPRRGETGGGGGREELEQNEEKGKFCYARTGSRGGWARIWRQVNRVMSLSAPGTISLVISSEEEIYIVSRRERGRGEKGGR